MRTLPQDRGSDRGRPHASHSTQADRATDASRSPDASSNGHRGRNEGGSGLVSARFAEAFDAGEFIWIDDLPTFVRAPRRPAPSPRREPTTAPPMAQREPPTAPAVRPAPGLSQRAKRRIEFGLATTVFALLTFLFFQPLFQGKTFSTVPNRQRTAFPWAALPEQSRTTRSYPQSDQADAIQPWQTFVSESLKKGDIPFWEPHSFAGGYPYFANAESSVFYPPRYLAALTLDPTLAHDVYSALHVFLAGIFMYALMKELDAGFGGALLAGVAWMFAGFNTAWLHFETLLPTAVFLPLAVLCVHRAFRLRTLRATAVGVVVLGLMFYSGHVVFLGLVYVVALAYAAALAGGWMVRGLREGQWRREMRELVRLAALAVLPLGLAAVVIVPTAHSLGDSQRDSFSYEELTTKVDRVPDGELPLLAPRGTLWHFFVPPSLPITTARMHEMAFAGTVVGGLAVIGFFRRRPGGWFGRVLLVATAAIATGGPLTWLVYHVVPSFDRFRPYSRLFFLTCFGLALLGGLGLDSLCRWSRRLVGSPRTDRPRLLATPRARRIVVVGAGVCLFATGLQLITYGRDVNPPFEPRRDALLFPDTSLLAAARGDVEHAGAWPGRIIPVTPVDRAGHAPVPMLPAGTGLLFGLDTAGGYDPIVPRRQAALLRILQGEDVDSVASKGLDYAYAPVYASAITRFDLLERLGITTVVASPKQTPTEEWGPPERMPPMTTLYEGVQGRVFHVNGSRPGPYLVHSDERVTSSEEALRRFLEPGFDFRRAVVIEEGELRRTSQTGLPAESATGEVLSASRAVNSARVEVTSNGAAWLVLPETWAEGWSAVVNGKRTSVLRANYSQRAIRVPPGQSTVALTYRPAGYSTGLAVTITTMLASLVGLGIRRRRGGRGRNRPTTGRRARATGTGFSGATWYT